MTQTIIKYLRQYPEKMPTWLMNYRPGDYVSFGDVMSGRVGYYPGSDFDGQLIKVGSASHSVHSFIYVDYWITEDDLELLAKGELESEIWPPLDKQGYSIIGRQEWNIKEILSPDEPCFEFKRKPRLGPPSLFRKIVFGLIVLCLYGSEIKIKMKQGG